MESGALHPAVVPSVIILLGIVFNASCYMAADKWWRQQGESVAVRIQRLQQVGWTGYGLAMAAAAAIFFLKLA